MLSLKLSTTDYNTNNQWVHLDILTTSLQSMKIVMIIQNLVDITVLCLLDRQKKHSIDCMFSVNAFVSGNLNKNQT